MRWVVLYSNEPSILIRVSMVDILHSSGTKPEFKLLLMILNRIGNNIFNFSFIIPAGEGSHKVCC